MKRLACLTMAAATLPLLAAGPPASALDQAWRLYHQNKYPAAQAAARAYQQVNGPSFQAAFLIAVAQCEITPHQKANVLALRQLSVDFIPSSSAQMAIYDNMKICGPQSPVAASVGGSAFSVGPSTAVVESDHMPSPLRHPPPPPRIIAAPTIPAAASTITAAAIPPAPRAVLRVPRPDACRNPFVWRQAFPGDHVCVAMQVRLDTQDDNLHASERRDPSGPYGPMTCIAGYVWRAARDGDTTCVIPQRRDQAVADNAVAASRRLQP